jgi:acyl-CoA thioester hydrolase
VDPFSHTIEVRVRFAETDAQAIAHNAAYLVWFELARVEYLRRHAGGYQALRDRGIEALVTESHVRYGAPARFDDLLRVHTRCVGIRGARFRYEYLVEREGVRVADGWTAHATVDAATFRPTRIPDWLLDAIRLAEDRPLSAPSSSSPASSSSASSPRAAS